MEHLESVFSLPVCLFFHPSTYQTLVFVCLLSCNAKDIVPSLISDTAKSYKTAFQWRPIREYKGAANVCF